MNSNSRQLHLHILYVNHIKEKTEAKMPNSRKGGDDYLSLPTPTKHLYGQEQRGLNKQQLERI